MNHPTTLSDLSRGFGGNIDKDETPFSEETGKRVDLVSNSFKDEGGNEEHNQA